MEIDVEKVIEFFERKGHNLNEIVCYEATDNTDIIDLETVMVEFAQEQVKKLTLGGVVKSLPSKEEITQVAEKRALKFNYVNEIGYLRHKKTFELGAQFVKEYLEKQK